MDLRGRILDGRYQLDSVLGVGGMARVYLADDGVLQRRVAVKVLSPPYAGILRLWSGSGGRPAPRPG
jgi:eukaryotic-like serine/threonine-protein kinase